MQKTYPLSFKALKYLQPQTHDHIYIQQLELWLNYNKMTTSLEKSSITIITTARHHSSFYPQVKLNSILFPSTNLQRTSVSLTTSALHSQIVFYAYQFYQIYRKLYILRTISRRNISNHKAFLFPSISSHALICKATSCSCRSGFSPSFILMYFLNKDVQTSEHCSIEVLTQGFSK